MSGSTATGEKRRPVMQALQPHHRTSALISSGLDRDQLPPPHNPRLAGGGGRRLSPDGSGARPGAHARRIGRKHSKFHTAGQPSQLKAGGAKRPRPLALQGNPSFSHTPYRSEDCKGLATK